MTPTPAHHLGILSPGGIHPSPAPPHTAPSPAVPLHVASPHAVPLHVASPHAVPLHVASPHAAPLHVASPHAAPLHVASPHAALARGDPSAAGGWLVISSERRSRGRRVRRQGVDRYGRVSCTRSAGWTVSLPSAAVTTRTGTPSPRRYLRRSASV